MTATAETSAAAYRDSAHHHPADRDLILSYLTDHPEGVICDRLAELWERPQHTISGRFKEMERAGLIVRNGERRETRTGSKAAVWIKKPQGSLF